MFATELNKALEILGQGGTILYPTDTIWGIGCDATNTEAVKKIHLIKKRAESKNLLILLDDEKKLVHYVRQVHPQAYSLMAHAKKPLTIIYDNAQNLAADIIAADATIAIRITRDAFCKQLIRLLDKPIVSTSANVSNLPPPGKFSDIPHEIINSVDHVVNLRQNETQQSTPSTIIRLKTDGTFQVIRE